jgi:hypothetical protein
MVELISMLFKRQKSFVRFYSLMPGLKELYPIIPAKNLKRQWILDNQTTSKCPVKKVFGSGGKEHLGHSANCPGITKLVDIGWIMCAPADFTIQTFGRGNDFKFNVPILFEKDMHWISSHPASITECLLDRPDDTLDSLVKVDTPWRIQTSDDIVLLQQHIPYNNQPIFTAANGIVDPKYSHEANVQLFWHVLDGEVTIKAGTPLVQYIPLSRKYLQNGFYDFAVEDADQQDKYVEEAFNYAKRSSFLRNVSLGDRISKTIKVTSLNKRR